MEKTLNGLQVLVTRPDPAGSVLCEAIRTKGGEAIHLPTIAFAPPEDEARFEEAVEQLGVQDWLVFVSPQAVYASIPAIRRQWPVFPSDIKITAIGAGTAEALQQAGYQVASIPQMEWNSEALFEMLKSDGIKGKKIAIIRGEGGREVLEAILAEEGAIPLSLIAYRRVLPAIELETNLVLLASHQIDAIVCTSFEGVKNLKLLLTDAAWPYLKKIPLIVISERIKELARGIGFQMIWVAKNASHQTILDCLEEKKEEICQIKQMLP